MSVSRGAKGEGYILYNKEQKVYIYRYPTGERTKNNHTAYISFRGKTKTEAIRKFKEYLSNMQNNIFSIETGEEKLEEYMLSWFENYKKGSNRLKGQSLSTIYRVMINQIFPCVGQYRLKDLTPDLLQRYFVMALLSKPTKMTGKPASYTTFHKAWVYLNECLEFAANMEHIPKNPMKVLQKPKKDVVDKNNVYNARFFSKEEVGRFLKALKAVDPKTNEPIFEKAELYELFLHTGLRAAELIGLRAMHVDLKNRRILVCENYSYYFDNESKETKRELTTTKTKSSYRHIFLDDISYDIISRLYYKAENHQSSFIASGTDTPISYNVLLKRYKRICEYANIYDPKGLHTLRHTFASLMYQNGNDTKMISTILGHSRSNITEDIYIHISEQQKMKNMYKMKDFLKDNIVDVKDPQKNVTEAPTLSAKDLAEAKLLLEKLSKHFA